MNIPCITDSDEFCYQADDDETDNLTDIERDLLWVCDIWKDALDIDNADEWKSVKDALFGATQAYNRMGYGYSMHREVLSDLSSLCFEHVLDAIRNRRYDW
jgi:hypothetical protein